MSFLRISALALIFLVPILVMTLLNFVLNSQSSAVTLTVVLPTARRLRPS